MSKKNEPQISDINNENSEQSSTRTYFFIAIVLLVLAAVAFGCAFIKGAGIYCLISSVLLELSALSFLSTQKKKNNFKAVFYVTVAAYVLLGLSLLLFIGGMIFVIVV
ncbi:MAG: hypothetical protein J1F61_01710 [Clostridiales bacterium]|nr:hypothetical protein [Clostridiales bacterium]